MSVNPRLSALMRLAGFVALLSAPTGVAAAMLNGVECESINIDVTENAGASDVNVNVLGCELGDPFPNAVCGDGTCNGSETTGTCAQDCPAPFCGDQSCNNGETQQSCPGDCGQPGPVCGDTVCEGTENSSNCPADCAAPPPTDCIPLERIVGDNWFGIDSISFEAGETKRFCANVTTDKNPMLRFESRDVSNKNCARVRLVVTQVSTGKQLDSGISQSPSMRLNARVSRSEYDYSRTPPGLYYMDLHELYGDPSCRRFAIAWTNH